MSEHFLVSARKYRPQRFDEVVGQEKITQTLKNAVNSDHIAHSYLFYGTRGVGKTTMARIFAKTINCQNISSDTEACNACESCISFNKNASFNVYELDAASKNSVDDIRILVEQVGFPPQNAKYKVFIIDEVHMLSTSAFNAFLKTLEEPPSYAKFILATTEKHKILPTILSRCQIYDFKKISVEDIQTHLAKICKTENIEADENALNLIAIKSDGGLRDALSMFDRLTSLHQNKLEYLDVLSNLNVLDYDYYFKFVNYIIEENHTEALLLLEEIIQNGFEPEMILQGFAEHIRDLWVAKKEKTMLLLTTTAEVKNQYREQAAKIDEPTLLNYITLISDTESKTKFLQNKRLQIEILLLKLCYLHKLMTTSWTEVDEKKKHNQVVTTPEVKTTPTQSTTSSKPDIPTSSKENKVVNMGDLLKIAKEKSLLEPVLQQDVTPTKIEDTDIWGKILMEIKDNTSSKELLESIKPIIDIHTFVFIADSRIKADMISKNFYELGNIYFQLTKKTALWKCKLEIPETEEDITKKEKFDLLAQEFPILNKIQKDFNLDFS